MTAPTLLVLAAGMGTRFGGLKQLAPIHPARPESEAILDYSIYDALRAGFTKVVFVIRKEIEDQFRNSIGKRIAPHIEVQYVLQQLDRLPAGFPVPAGRTKPWGTTHAILMAEEQIHEPFAVINADDFYGSESYSTLGQHLRSGSDDYAMVGYPLRNTLSDFGPVARGLCRLTADGYLQSIVELTGLQGQADYVVNTTPGGVHTLSGDELVSMNMWGLTPAIFPQLQARFEAFLRTHGSDLDTEIYIPNAVNELVQHNTARVKVLRSDGVWFGITYREDQPHVADGIDRLTREGHYPEQLWA
jgi:NDP-sugar pyrophosphorylase family protein